MKSFINKYKNSCLIIFLCFLISFSGSALFYPTSVSADQVKDAQNKYNNINNSIKSNKNKVDEINKSKAEVQSQIDSLNSKICDISQKLSALNIKINSLNTNIAQTQKEIDDTQKKLDKEIELYNTRIRVMYEQGNMSYYQVIFDSKSFDDLIKRAELISKIIVCDQNTLKSIKSDKTKLKNKKSSYEKKAAEVKSLKADADSQYNSLQSNCTQKNKLVASLEKDKQYYQNMIDQQQKDSNDVKNLITKLLAEAAQKNANSGGGQSSGGSSSQPSHSGNYYCVTGRRYPITENYGWRIHPITGQREFHPGIDIGVPYGTPIYSLTDGVVIYAGWENGYGNFVMIDHGGIVSAYGHNSSIVVSVGQRVKGGQQISYSGSTGMSTGPHLHFEVRNESGGTIDPTGYYK